MRSLIFILVTAICLLPALSWAEIYKWKDSEGGMHYANDYNKVPEEYREGVSKRDSSPPDSTPVRSSPKPLRNDVQDIKKGEKIDYKAILNRDIKNAYTACQAYLIENPGSSCGSLKVLEGIGFRISSSVKVVGIDMDISSGYIALSSTAEEIYGMTSKITHDGRITFSK